MKGGVCMATFVDMFAGAGGFSEGFLQVEEDGKYFDFLLGSDINPTCEVTHGKDWEKLQLRLQNGKNSAYWIKKITRNRERDNKVEKALRFREWTVLRFWGEDIKKNTNDCVKIIEEAIDDYLCHIY